MSAQKFFDALNRNFVDIANGFGCSNDEYSKMTSEEKESVRTEIVNVYEQLFIQLNEDEIAEIDADSETSEDLSESDDVTRKVVQLWVKHWWSEILGADVSRLFENGK